MVLFRSWLYQDVTSVNFSPWIEIRIITLDLLIVLKLFSIFLVRHVNDLLIIFLLQAQTTAYVEYFGQFTSEQFPDDITEVHGFLFSCPLKSCYKSVLIDESHLIHTLGYVRIFLKCIKIMLTGTTFSLTVDSQPLPLQRGTPIGWCFRYECYTQYFFWCSESTTKDKKKIVIKSLSLSVRW